MGRAYLQTLIWFEKKVKSLYDNFEQKKGERSKLENLMPAKDGLIILERKWAYKCQDNRRSNFRPPRSSRLVPKCH